MRLSKRRTAYASILGLGLVALVLDRTVFDSAISGPAPAGAAERAPAARASLVGGEMIDRGLAVVSVGERLEKFRRTQEGAGIADAFATVGGWFERAAQKQPSVAAPVVSDFKVTSVSSTMGMATVNGVRLYLDKDVDVTTLDKTRARRVTVRLTSIGKRCAVIETEGQRLELKVGEPENEVKSK